MGLKIYPDATPDSPYSQDGDMTEPLRQAFDGRRGQTVEQRCYLRNDDALYLYSGIQIQPIDQTGKDIVGGTDGFSWKLNAGNDQPIDDEWEVITAGRAISMSNLGTWTPAHLRAADTSTYLPFWLRIEIPRGAKVASYNDVILRVVAAEELA